MDFKLVSKNNLGAVATLFLVILLSHARFFDFLIDTALGRAILILFILGISYTNKILGVVAVLFIIIAFNNSDIGYLEGFTYSSTTTPNIKEKKGEVKEKVYDVLTTKTKLNLLNNRRKPSKIDFNSYYSILKRELVNERFSNVELFNELSVYFSDNLFNMFKLLDNRWRNVIIEELHEHIGKNTQSKDIMNRNIYEGTEVEFKHIDILDEIKYFTGVVIEVDYNNSMFKIDSFENVYDISINDITKILNNTKFKHNLNKLDNIDFL